MAGMARARRKADEPAAAAAPSVLARLRERLSLPGLESWSTNIRTVLLNLFFLVVVIVLVPLLIGQFRRDQVIIEPIAVPESLAARGLTAEVTASRIWDGLADVKLAARTSKDSIAALPDARRVEFSFPDSGLSIESLVFHVRRLFNAYETRIAGEFICDAADCAPDGMRLRLRVIRDSVELVDLPPIGAKPERDYFRDAASGILSVLDPFVAIAAASETEPLKATILARRMIRSHHKDAKWAHNLIGLIRSNGGETAAAIAEFRAALALDPAFLPARTNLGQALATTGDLAAAKVEYAEARRLDPKNVFAAEGFAEIALAEGDADAAVKLYLEAAEAAPVDPRYPTKAGRILLGLGRTDEGTAQLTRALELDPGYLPAFAELAAMHLVKGDHKAAERIYRDAADYAPNDADAQSSHGRMLAIVGDFAAAELRYARAVELMPTSAAYRLELGRILQRLKRHADALVQLDEARKLDPANADVWMSLGDSYRDTGRNPDAVAAYKKYLELATPDAFMRPVAERFIELLSG
jgi:tetratricopeptide (TPR) repeat protein